MSATHRETGLILWIGESVYHLERLGVESPVKLAWEMRKQGEDRSVYHVHVDPHGAHCTCADFLWRQKENQPIERQCKHVVSLLVEGLLPGPWLPQRSYPCSTSQSSEGPLPTDTATGAPVQEPT